MELLSSTAINFKPCLSRLSLVSTPIQSSYSLQQPKKKFTHFQKLSSSQNLLCQKSSSTRRSPVQLAVSDSAVAAADTDTVMDKLPGDIEVTETEEPESRVRLSVTIPPVVCEDCYKRVIEEFSKRSRMPGFRQGKIPENLLISHVGVASVRKATIESILRRTLPHAMSSVKGRALKDSVRIVTQFSEMDEFFSSHNYLRYEALVDVAPEVKWVPEDGYKNLNIVVEIDNDIDAETACEAEIKRRHKALGSLRIVTDRGLQVGDVALVDISTVKAGEDESVETIPSAESKGFQLDTEEAESLPPGFLDSVIGIKQGETKSFTLVFPESWRQENLRGVHAQFTVECKELFYRDLPVLDDSLAEKLLPGCSTLSQVRESILQRCKEIEQTAREQAADNAILDQTCKMVQVEIPQSLFDEQGRQLYGSKLLEIQANMKLTEEQLSSLSSPAAVNEYLKGQRENIINLVKMNLAVGDIFKRENLQYSTDELVEKVADSVNEFKRNNQEFDEERVKEQVQEILEGAKVIEWLREHATIQYVTNGQAEKLEQ